MSDIHIRPATADDAAFTLTLSDIASYGLVEQIFRPLVPEGETLQGFLLARVADPASRLSWMRCHIAEISGERVGYISLDPIPLDPDPLDDDLPAMFRPLAELEAMAPGTTVIEFIATLPVARGKGAGSALLKQAFRQRGPKGLSLIVLDSNTNARRLYEAAGFVEKARRPVVKDSWQIDASEWVLMTHP